MTRAQLVATAVGALRERLADDAGDIEVSASYADDAREYGAPSPRIDEIRKELTR